MKHQLFCTFSVDDGHKRRLKLLERAMVKAVDVLDALQGRAYQLYQPNGALHAMDNQALSTTEVELRKQSKRTTEEVLQSIGDPNAFCDSALRIPRRKALPGPTPLGVGDEDLIDLSLRE